MTSHSDRAETRRVEAFSDAVFAIAITLLGLELKVPDAVGVSLGASLAASWPSYLAFFTSFVTITVVWIHHHRLFMHIVRVDHALLLLNALVLMVATIVPFGTAVLSKHLPRAEHAPTAAMLYNGVLMALTGTFNLLWQYAARRHRLLDAATDKKTIRRIKYQYGFGPALYLVTFVLAFFSPWASVVADLVFVGFFALPVFSWGGAEARGLRHAVACPPVPRERKEVRGRPYVTVHLARSLDGRVAGQ